jgi:rod shape-determining protein MreC
MPRKHFRLYVFIVAITIFLMTYQSLRGNINPFGFLAYPMDFANNLITSMGISYNNAIWMAARQDRELEELRMKLRDLSMIELRFSEVLAENRRLAGLIGLSESSTDFVVAARVVSRGSNRWSTTYVIDRGGEHLVNKDMTVITPEGLLGKIIELKPNYSRVLLLDDTRFSAAVRLQSSRAEGVLTGNGRGRCILKYVGTDVKPKINEMVVTSGMDALFPPGIGVGLISRITTDEEELFHDIEVEPLVDTTRVEEVIVIKR